MEDGKPELADYIIESYEDLKLYNTVKKDMHKTLLGMEWHSIEAVATVKKTQEHFDRLHMYEVNDKKIMDNHHMFLSHQLLWLKMPF